MWRKTLNPDCRFKNKRCNTCSKIGDIARVRRKGKTFLKLSMEKQKKAHPEGMKRLNLLEFMQCTPLQTAKKGYSVDVKLGDKGRAMLLDTGSAVAVVS